MSWKSHGATLGIAQIKRYAEAFLRRNRFSYTFATADASNIAASYNPKLPMAVVIDRQGRMVVVFSGYFGEESDRRLEELIRELL